MEELITINDVKEILKVDRLTVYRMLKDGRLKGVKVGRQWRIPSSEVKELISGNGSQEPAPELRPDEILPVHCVQALQDVFAEVTNVASVTSKVDGEPLTEMSNSCQFCDLILSSPKGRAACIASWKALVHSPKHENQFVPCHAGLQISHAPIEQVGELIGVQIVGQVIFDDSVPDENEQRVRRLAQDYGINEIQLLDARKSIRKMPAVEKNRIHHWLSRMAETFEIIALERADLIGRLESIAALTSFSD